MSLIDLARSERLQWIFLIGTDNFYGFESKPCTVQKKSNLSQTLIEYGKMKQIETEPELSAQRELRTAKSEVSWTNFATLSM